MSPSQISSSSPYPSNTSRFSANPLLSPPPATMGSKYLLLLHVLLSCFLFTTVSSVNTTDITNLIAFKNSLGNPKPLAGWNPNVSPCNNDTEKWTGIICGKDGSVIGLQLENMGLTGTINMNILGEISSIRTLSIANNSFGGGMPEVRRIRGLRSVYLANNEFSGVIGDDVFAGMSSMRKIEVQGNRFSGKIPESLTGMNILVDLQMQDNEFEGEIPEFEQKGLKVNFANNRLYGPVPRGLMSQNASSFAGNNLCGEPLTNPCKIYKQKHTRKTVVATVAIIGVLAIVVLSLLILRARRNAKNNYKYQQTTKINNNPYKTNTNEIQIHHHEEKNPKRAENGGKLQFVRADRERFDLQDLLRASAEVLGGGSFGSSYKAALLGGPAVVVKRFREMSNVRKEEFYVHMTRLGRLSHPNLLPLVAFYYKKEEKLLITDYAENGSLASHLHGKRKPNETGLDWPTRLNIIKGVGQGLDYLYEELHHLTLPHGHLKSSNVLLGNAFNPLLADYGLIPVVNKHHGQEFMVAFKSPEFTNHDRTTTKTDVWCLGILILEILTGKFPANYLKQGQGESSDLETWVNSVVREEWTGEVFDKDMKGTKNGEGEMLKLLKIGMCCCEWNIEKRWDLKVALEKIGELKERVSDEEYSSCASDGDAYSSRIMTDEDFSFSVIS